MCIFFFVPWGLKLIEPAISGLQVQCLAHEDTTEGSLPVPLYGRTVTELQEALVNYKANRHAIVFIGNYKPLATVADRTCTSFTDLYCSIFKM